VFEQIAAAEKSGMSDEDKKKLEEQAAEKVHSVHSSDSGVSDNFMCQGLQALFKGLKLEIDSVIRETCDRVLTSPPPSTSSKPINQGTSRTVSPNKLALRAIALQMLGEAYLAVEKDEDVTNEEAGYVRVDTKASKGRETGTGRTSGTQ
jgi:hypothetical protein